jgi:hypothetical protein
MSSRREPPRDLPKTKLTADFLKRKMVEYHALKKEIDSLKSSLKD